ncbi:MAG TPA: ECF-type sigma factor, partial [Thermoanaerobaculia bacterium]|nr:ECF-type sigma factor [Thermoanaerobaculia bacterium]
MPGRRDPRDRVTDLLGAITAGQEQASDELLPLVYGELRKLARARLAREAPGVTLQATDLVHEAYLRLVRDDGRWESRGHFFAAAAEAMRRILIERARRATRRRHGGGLRRTTLNDDQLGSEPPPDELLAIDEALTRLEARDRAMASVVKLRFF